jgi:hypothetical protein
MIIAGGGVQYSRAVAELTAFAEAHQIPVVETIAGRANLLASIRSTSAPSASPARTAPMRLPKRPMSSSPSAPGCRISPPAPGPAFDKARSFISSTPRGTMRPSTCRCRWWATRNWD